MVSQIGASFSHTRKGGMVIYMVMGYAQIFYRGWCCFPGGYHPPLNLSAAYTRLLSLRFAWKKVLTYLRQSALMFSLKICE